MSANHDFLAELELTMVPSVRTGPRAGLYVPAAEASEAPAGRGSCRRSFWCASRDEGVEVEFETKRVLGLPRIAGVRRCSAFDEPEQVACGRQCLDSRYRRQWPFALPTTDRRRPPGD